MLTELIKKLLKTERAPFETAANLRQYLYSDAAQNYVPVEDASKHAPAPTVLDVASLIEWCAAAGPGQVVISRKSITSASSPFWCESHVKRETASKPFFLGFMPGEVFDATLGYEDMLAWTELLGDKLDDSTGIESALKMAACVTGGEMKAEQSGAVIRITGTTDNNVKLAGTLPKRLKATIPFGDPACEIAVQWALQVTVSKEGAASFRLRHLISDGAFDAYAAWMREQLKALPEGWLVVVGL